jgi:hypothetical protein
VDESYFRVSRQALYAYLATLIWMTLPSGVYFIFKGELWGASSKWQSRSQSSSWPQPLD